MFSAIHLSFFPYCILGMRNRQISERFDYGYKSNLLKKYTFRSLIPNFYHSIIDSLKAPITKNKEHNNVFFIVSYL